MKIETVAQMFAEYRAYLIPQDAPDYMVGAMERAFHAGAYAVLIAMYRRAGGDRDDGIMYIDAIRTELETFIAKTSGASNETH